MLRTSILTVLVLAITPAAALAQRAPDMATLDRGDGTSKLGLDAGLSLFDAPPDAYYGSALRLELSGQYVLRSGFGFYGALPFAASFGAPGDDIDPVPPDLLPNDDLAAGDLDAGVLYTMTKSPTFSLVFRGGLGFPTATSTRDGSATLFAAQQGSRFTDVVLATDAWYARAAISPLVYANHFFFQADLGVDLNLDGDYGHLLRVNAGAGYDFGAVALSLELVNIIYLDDDIYPDNDVDSNLAGAVRFMGEKLRPYIAVGGPLDDSYLQLFIAGGIQLSL
jgi:hypothetical protein